MRSKVSKPWRHKPVRGLVYVLVASVALGAAVTSSKPWTPAVPAPTAEQARAAKAGLLAVRNARAGHARAQPVPLTQEQLAGISALASHGLRPDRLSLGVSQGILVAKASRRLPGGRWLNLRATLAGTSSGFPSPRLSIGWITLPASLGRYPFELARWVLILRGTELPPLNEMVREVAVGDRSVTARLSLPSKSGLVDNLARLRDNPIDAAAVVKAYCGLAAMQRVRPRVDFAAQVRRAFAFPSAGTSPERNGAALVALAMLVADERAGYLAGVERQQVHACHVAPFEVTLHGRADLPKHWALSAAIAATQGTQLARAVGEWKELADSLASQSSFAAGDPSGFSFVDLAADRAGFQTAKAATNAGTAGLMADRLAEASGEQLLPKVLLQQPDGMTGGEFERQFGSVEAAPYKAAVVQINRVLRSRW